MGIARRRGISSWWIDWPCTTSMPDYDYFDWKVVRLRDRRHTRSTRAAASQGQVPFIRGGPHWRTASLFRVWHKYHVHCQSSHTSNKHNANNRLCHKTAQAEIFKDLPILLGSSLESSRAGRKIRSQVRIPRTPITEPPGFHPTDPISSPPSPARTSKNGYSSGKVYILKRLMTLSRPASWFMLTDTVDTVLFTNVKPCLTTATHPITRLCSG